MSYQPKYSCKSFQINYKCIHQNVLRGQFSFFLHLLPFEAKVPLFLPVFGNILLSFSKGLASQVPVLLEHETVFSANKDLKKFIQLLIIQSFIEYLVPGSNIYCYLKIKKINVTIKIGMNIAYLKIAQLLFMKMTREN